MDVLRSNAYDPRQIAPRQLLDALDDVGLLEFILNSEMCVFLLDQQVTYADVLLAMAYAHCVPSIRLQYDPAAAKVETAAESGRIRWSSADDILTSFRAQVGSYRMGFIQAVSTQDVRNIAITQRTPRPEQLWDPNDGLALIEHINPASVRARDIVNAVRKLTGGSFVNADPSEISTLLYRFVRVQHFAYEHEPPTLAAGRQAIRTADDIWNDNAATCLDLACLFASLLKGAGLSPIIVILARPNFSHALVGYKAPDAARWQSRPDIGDLRGSMVLRDIILFEPTGVVEHGTAVGGELAQERRDGNRTLEFEIAKIAAERLMSSQIELRYVLEIP
jgi:hypothetical protein